MFTTRRIKSYVLRQGRLTSGQEKALKSLWPTYGLGELGGKGVSNSELSTVNFESIFRNNHPVIFEIGFGNGESLIEMAQRQSSLNFVGVEVHKPGLGRILMGAHERSLQNIRFFCEDALWVLEKAISDQSLFQVNLFFPDPWKKKRHHKRRILNEEFLDLLSCKLSLGGGIHFATDWEDYAKQALSLVNAHKNFLNKNKDGGYSEREARPVTKFERRGRAVGHLVWDIQAVVGSRDGSPVL